jgi:hypothetical protein
MRRLGMRNFNHRRGPGWIAAMAAAVVVLALPAVASGAGYTGTLDDGGTVNFRSVTKNGKLVGVKDFRWNNVPTQCLQGPYSYSAQLPFSLSVRNRLFAITATEVGMVQAVTGKFTSNRNRASGTLNVYGALAPRHTNCSTGLVEWSATRR